jgi:hypothetical protein
VTGRLLFATPLTLALLLACSGPPETHTLLLPMSAGGPNNWLAFSLDLSSSTQTITELGPATAINVYTRFGCSPAAPSTIEELLSKPHTNAALPHRTTAQVETVTLELEPLVVPATLTLCVGTRSSDGTWHWPRTPVDFDGAGGSVTLPLTTTDADAVSVFPAGAFVKSVHLGLRRY